MMELVTLYGKPSHQYEIIKNALLDSINKANLEIKIHEIQDTASFIDLELNKIPAIKYRSKIKNLEATNVNDFIKEVNQWILKNQNYGCMKQIVVPIDYSKTSENALIFAKALSSDLNGVIKIIHAFHPTVKNYSTSDYDELVAIEKERFNQHIAQLNKVWIGSKETNIPLDAEFKTGLAGDVITKLSSDLKNSLIVIGTKKSNQAQKEWLGSVSTHLVKKSASPLLIVPPDATYTGLKNIMICSNDTSLDVKISSEIISLLGSNKPNIHLVHVGEDDNYDFTPLLDHWKKIYRPDKVHFNKIVHKPDTSVLDSYCKQYKIDIMIAGRARRNFIQELIHSSFSKKMAIHSSIPLLIINDKTEH